MAPEMLPTLSEMSGDTLTALSKPRTSYLVYKDNYRFVFLTIGAMLKAIGYPQLPSLPPDAEKAQEIIWYKEVVEMLSSYIM